MGNYRISLIVPIYGVERYIGKFAETALGQDSDGIQFIFVNDGTKDRSVQILQELIDERFSHLKPHIKIINKENQGLPLARKTGLDHAEGEYVLFADSDDWLETDAVRKILARIDETDADIVYFDRVKEYGHKVSYKKERDYAASQKMDFIVNIFNYRSQGYTVTKCFRRRLYTDNHIYIPKYGMHEDIYLMSQIIFHAESLSHLPEALYHYRKDNPDSFCAQDRELRHLPSDRNLLDLYEHYRDSLKGSPVEMVAGGILMRAGWHSIIHGYDLFKDYPYLAEDILRSRMSGRYRIPLPVQLIVKIYALFRR